MDRPPSVYALGFIFGPRVNAGGRIGQADLGARLLSTASETEAADLAQRLDLLNGERRAIEAAVRAEALAQAEARGTEAPLVWAAGEGWHPGVVGIVAARLKEAFHRPAVVIGIEGGLAKGSARSVTGVDLGASVHRLQSEGLISSGGGHKMAAGLSMRAEQIGPAMARLAELLAKQGAGTGGPEHLRISNLMAPAAATPELIEQIEAAGPFGQSAPAPRFAFAAQNVSARRIGENHLKLSFGAPGTALRLEAMAFGGYDSPLAALDGAGHRLFHLAGKLELNHWGGRARVQLRLDDAAPAD
jgi:single-stranded-DNA-specific exonuclease